MIFQAGDVLIKKISQLPDGVKETCGNIVHQGLNHSHRISGEFKLFENGEYIYAINGCALEHDEHDRVEIDNGFYKKRIVNEYDHWLEESREVVD